MHFKQILQCKEKLTSQVCVDRKTIRNICMFSFSSSLKLKLCSGEGGVPHFCLSGCRQWPPHIFLAAASNLLRRSAHLLTRSPRGQKHRGWKRQPEPGRLPRAASPCQPAGWAHRCLTWLLGTCFRRKGAGPDVGRAERPSRVGHTEEPAGEEKQGTQAFLQGLRKTGLP